jgi:hypothetical protein
MPSMNYCVFQNLKNDLHHAIDVAASRENWSEAEEAAATESVKAMRELIEELRELGIGDDK